MKYALQHRYNEDGSEASEDRALIHNMLNLTVTSAFILFFSLHYINFSFTLTLFVVSDQLQNFRRKGYQGSGIKE